MMKSTTIYKKYLPKSQNCDQSEKTNTNYCTFTIIIWLFRSVVYLWHLTCIPYEVMPIQFFDWLTTYISNSRVHIFICMNTLVLIIMNKWKDANIYTNITPTTYLLVHFQFQSKCKRSPLYCWEKNKTWCYYWAFFIECILSLVYFVFIYFLHFFVLFFSFAELNDIGTFAFCKLIPKLS